jgi:hypothetical protein
VTTDRFLIAWFKKRHVIVFRNRHYGGDLATYEYDRIKIEGLLLSLRAEITRRTHPPQDPRPLAVPSPSPKQHQ